MTSDSNYVAGTIEDVLIAMANGLTEAQAKLNSLEPFDSFGRPLPQYHMPYMDFNLKITVQSVVSGGASAMPVAAEVGTPTGAATHRIAGPSQAVMLAAVRPAMTVGMPRIGAVDNSQREIISTISGRFVSVPPADGMPQLMLSATVAQGDAPKAFTVTLTARFGDGAVAAGRLIEANIDTAATMMANTVAALTFTAPDILSSGNMMTDAAGVAVFAVNLNAITQAAVQEVHLVFNLGPVKARAMVGGA